VAENNEFPVDTIQNEAKALVLSAQKPGGPYDLRSAVISRLAKEKLVEREQLLFDGVKKYDELRKELAKVSRPDAITQQRGADGNWTKVEQFTDAGVKKIKDAEKKLTEFKAAYLKALDDKAPDYEPLKKVLGKSQGGDKGGANMPEQEPTD
jgi:hypothetical protein